MRLNQRLLLATCSTLVCMAQPAHAENLFLLQLGLFSSKVSADSAYQESQTQYGDILQDKHYIPQQSRPLNGGEDKWRVLVGPFENRKQASRSCAELKDKGQDCFVVETAAVNIEELKNGRSFAAPEAAEPSSTEASSGFNPFGLFNSGNDKEDAGTISAENVTADSSKKLPSIDPNTHININTRSLYSESKETPESNVNLVESIRSLFDASDAPAKEQTAALNAAEAEKEAVTESTEITPEAPAASTAPLALQKEASEENTKPDYDVNRKGDVEVSEAIPVPLTEPDQLEVTESEAAPIENAAKQTAEENKLPVVRPESSKPIVVKPEIVPQTNSIATQHALGEQSTPPAMRRLVEGERTIQLSIFESDQQAFQCLSGLQQRIPQAAMLKARIIKSTTGQAILRLGPLNDAEIESTICDQTSPCGSDIQCRLISSSKPTEEAKPEPYDSNSPMPKNLTNYDAMKQTPAVMTTLDDQGVWVQLGTSSSESEAQERFDTLRKQNADVLNAYEPVINTPEYQSLAGKVYRLRIGPFAERKQAQTICATLSSRGVGCLVLSK